MESTKPLHEQVVAAFRERNIPVKREDIEAALQDTSNTIATRKWVVDHLGAHTLLSKEELTL
jgi:hypothetical protein